MGFGVFIHRADTFYDDSPANRYQFPKIYLSRAKACVGDWIIYYEPVKVPNSRGYYAMARVSKIVQDELAPDRYYAHIEPDTYLDFPNPVPFKDASGLVELGLANAQAAVRPLAEADFFRILTRSLADLSPLLPRIDGTAQQTEIGHFEEGQAPFIFEQERERITAVTTRVMRDRVFRRVILRAYDERCGVTGLKLINGGGRAEVEAAHIRPVERNGPDMINNGIALSGTAHWMFDRGLIGFSDDLHILVSRHVNDRDGVESLINKSGKLIGPMAARDRPHPAFLSWHRENCFKH